MNNIIISNKYKLDEKISEGSFGYVYKAENIRTREFVAIKFENKNNTIKSLKNEAKIYQYLGKLEGFPQLKFFGTTDNTNYLVIDLLGKSLDSLIYYYKVLSLKTTLVLGIQLIKRIQTLHEMFLLHRDIKPSNLLFGNKERTNKLFLVDFGFSKRYNYNGIHIEEKNIRNIVGSTNFVSLNVNNLIEPSRRDDIESGVYVILTMLFGKLEWFGKTDINEIISLKTKIINVYEVPLFIKKILYYLRSMGFDEKPDYDYIINLMIQEFNNNLFTNNDKFEWN
jgi:serine/threonine protein kinase